MKVFREKWLVYAQNRKIESVLNHILGIIDNICISETYMLCSFFLCTWCVPKETNWYFILYLYNY